MNTPNNSNVALLPPLKGSALEDRLRALSPEAKTWLEETCNRFAEGEGYEKNEAAIAECLAADLIRKRRFKRRFYIDIHEDVMGLVYSENFFGHNTAPTRPKTKS